jgi:hypothetical protein
MKIIIDIIRHKHDIIDFDEKFYDTSNASYIHDKLREYDQSLDMILVKFTQVIDHIFKDYTWYIDFMHLVETEVKMSSKMIMDVISNIELISLDILEARQLGLYKDKIEKFKDSLREDPRVNKLYTLIDWASYTDKIYNIINTVNARNDILLSNIYQDDSIIHYNDNIVFNDTNIKNYSDDIIESITKNIYEDKNDNYCDDISYIETSSAYTKDSQILLDVLDRIDNMVNTEDSLFSLDSIFEVSSDGNVLPLK